MPTIQSQTEHLLRGYFHEVLSQPCGPRTFTFSGICIATKGDDAQVRKQLFVWKKAGYFETVRRNGEGQPAHWDVTEQGETFFSKLPTTGNPFHSGSSESSTPPPKLPPVKINFLGAVPGIPATNATVSQLFGRFGHERLEHEIISVWNHSDAPAYDPDYIWPDILPQALTQFRRGRNVALYGEKGTGKTSFAMQLAATLQRPFVLISGDANMEANELVGMTVPWGEKHWQDGQLTAAIRVPGTIICLDEPSVCRPGVLFVFQNLLQNRVLTIKETGEQVPVAPGVLFMCTDNTNGRGGGNRRGYTDTNRLNAATIDRFGAWLKVDFLEPAKEAKALASRSGCSLNLARALVEAAGLTRQAVTRGDLSEALTMRRLVAWAELLMDGIKPDEAFASSVLNTLPEVDVVPMKQQCSIMLDFNKVALLLK